MSKVIVTGGAGYIGSHTVVNLIESGHEVVCIDNFFNSHKVMWSHLEQLVGRKVPQYNIDLTDAEAVDQVFSAHKDADAVIHFAARIYVGESVEKPITYFRQNLNSMLNVLESMTKYGQRTFIFSSSCSVYGNAKQLPVTEATPFGVAESPYARTKQMGEQIITDFVRANPEIHSVILRYFNPAGAHPSGLIGEAPQVEQTHLVPIIMEVGTGHRKELTVFGGDYPTRDGSCLRDFIHVSDLGSAHTRAVEFGLEKASAKTDSESNPSIFNLGSGDGVTVLEAVQAYEKVTGNALPHKIVEPRDGDVAAIYAKTTKAAEELGWTPQYNMEDIVKTAWAWEQARPGKLNS